MSTAAWFLLGGFLLIVAAWFAWGIIPWMRALAELRRNMETTMDPEEFKEFIREHNVRVDEVLLQLPEEHRAEFKEFLEGP